MARCPAPGQGPLSSRKQCQPRPVRARRRVRDQPARPGAVAQLMRSARAVRVRDRCVRSRARRDGAARPDRPDGNTRRRAGRSRLEREHRARPVRLQGLPRNGTRRALTALPEHWCSARRTRLSSVRPWPPWLSRLSTSVLSSAAADCSSSTHRRGHGRRASATRGLRRAPSGRGTGAPAPSWGGSCDQRVVARERADLDDRLSDAATLGAFGVQGAGMFERGDRPMRGE